MAGGARAAAGDGRPARRGDGGAAALAELVPADGVVGGVGPGERHLRVARRGAQARRGVEAGHRLHRPRRRALGAPGHRADLESVRRAVGQAGYRVAGRGGPAGGDVRPARRGDGGAAALADLVLGDGAVGGVGPAQRHLLVARRGSEAGGGGGGGGR